MGFNPVFKGLSMRLWILFAVIRYCPFASLCCSVVGLCRQLTRFECCFDYNWQFAYDRMARTGGVELETRSRYYNWFCCVNRLKTASTFSRFKCLYEDMSALGKDTPSITKVASMLWQSLRTSNFSVHVMFSYRRAYVIAYFAPHVTGNQSYFDARYSFSLFRCHDVLLAML